MEDVRVAAVTCRCPAGEIRDNLDNTAEWVGRARTVGASLVCFPELNISGYCLDRGQYEKAAESYDQVVRDLSALAVGEGLTVLAGTVRQAGNSGLFAACHLVAEPDGSVGVYEKIHIAPPEVGLLAAGSTIPLFLQSNTRFGLQLCYDAHFPELSTRMALDGAEIIFMPHASPRKSGSEKLSSWLRHLPARAYDNSLFVIAGNQSGKNGAGLDFPGLALALSPSGEVLGQTLSSDDMLVIDLSAGNMSDIRNHRMRFFLPHRRPDIY